MCINKFCILAPMRRAAKVDSNHTEVVNDLRQRGATVLNTHQLKNAFDILVGYAGRNWAFEIKDGNKPPSQRKLTKGEQAFQDSWKGQIHTIHTAQEAWDIMTNKPFQERIKLERK